MTKYLEGRGTHPPMGPSGRKAIGPGPVTHTAVRAHSQHYSDGQPIDGVRDSSKDQYQTPEQHRAALRGTPYPGQKSRK